MITWIEVVDTAVKVGLGALIAGFASYVISNRNHENEIGKLKVTRRQELLEGIAEKVETFSNSFRKYSNISRRIIEELVAGKSIEDDVIERHAKFHTNVHECVDSLSSAQSLLVLLGEDEVEENLLKYIIDTQEFVIKTERPAVDTSVNEIIKLQNTILDSKKHFFQSLHNAYKKIGF